jgi:hypothetical protein
MAFSLLDLIVFVVFVVSVISLGMLKSRNEKSGEAFSLLDLIVFVVFVVSVISLGMLKSRNEKSGEDYFLAGRGLKWWLIGFSLIAANISTEQFVGMSGNAASHVGLAIASYEWMAGRGGILLPAVLSQGGYLYHAGVFGIPLQPVGAFDYGCCDTGDLYAPIGCRNIFRGIDDQFSGRSNGILRELTGGCLSNWPDCWRICICRWIKGLCLGGSDPGQRTDSRRGRHYVFCF